MQRDYLKGWSNCERWLLAHRGQTFTLRVWLCHYKTNMEEDLELEPQRLGELGGMVFRVRDGKD